MGQASAIGLPIGHKIACAAHSTQRQWGTGTKLNMTVLPEDRREFRSGSEPASFDDFQDWIDNFDSQPYADSAALAPDPRLDDAAQVELAAGGFFRRTWRRRLADAQGDYGHVARQMRKAGVPLELALAVLLAPEHRASAPTEPSVPAAPPHAAAIAVQGHAARRVPELQAALATV
jgi:hypothetical protein